MRLKPAVGGTVRVSDREVLLAGRYRIPAGTALWTPTYIVHNSRHVWGPDAGEYKPVRRPECVQRQYVARVMGGYRGRCKLTCRRRILTQQKPHLIAQPAGAVAQARHRVFTATIARRHGG